MLIKSVDASSHIKDAQLICELLDGFIREIGLHYVVEVITDNVANYVIIGKCYGQIFELHFSTVSPQFYVGVTEDASF